MYLEKETIATVDIDYFRKYKEEMDEDYVDYVDENVVVARNIDNLPESNQMIRLNLFIIVTCIEGKLQLSVNGKGYQLQTGEAFICLPTMILSRLLFSAGHHISMIGFSTGFLQRTMKKEADTTALMSYIFKYPIQYASKEGRITNVEYYENLLSAKLKNNSTHYQKEILQHLFSALFFEIMSVLYNNMDKGVNPEKKSEIKQPSLVFRRFMEELTQDNGMHRTVNYFADRLCYSPKYVSSVVKQVSGRTAMEWINEYTIEQIKHRLKFSEKSVKEIAEEFNFPNQSFFGKYVKAHVGMSPARYRNQRER